MVYDVLKIAILRSIMLEIIYQIKAKIWALLVYTILIGNFHQFVWILDEIESWFALDNLSVFGWLLTWSWMFAWFDLLNEAIMVVLNFVFILLYKIIMHFIYTLTETVFFDLGTHAVLLVVKGHGGYHLLIMYRFDPCCNLQRHIVIFIIHLILIIDLIQELISSQRFLNNPISIRTSVHLLNKLVSLDLYCHWSHSGVYSICFENIR